VGAVRCLRWLRHRSGSDPHRPPGAGKTTTARTLVGRWERAVHLESDHFFHFIRSGYVEPLRPESGADRPLADRDAEDASEAADLLARRLEDGWPAAS
jgi:hypothetical protein